jgi:hypothetical protein
MQVFDAELSDTITSKMLMNELPVNGSANIWGEEIFFPLTFTSECEPDACEEVEEGTLAYWPPGKAFCIFFGPTPVSTSEKPRAYSPVNVLGKIHGNLDGLRRVTQGEKITVDFAIEE